MGSFEKLLVLTVIFLSAVVLAVSLTAPEKESRFGGSTPVASVGESDSAGVSPRSPSEALQQAGSPALESGEVGSGAPGLEVASISSGDSGNVFELAAGDAKDSPFRADSTQQDLGALNADAEPGRYPLTPGARVNPRGEPRILLDVPGLERSPVADERTYVVGEGDTWLGLSQLFYDSENFVELLRNTNDSISARPELKRITVPVFGLPDAMQAQAAQVRTPRAVRDVRGAVVENEPIANATEAATPAESTRPLPAEQAPVEVPSEEVVADESLPALPTTHVIQRGESFFGIAKQYYGKGTLWRELWAANRELIPNPDFVPEGTKIVVPKL